MKKYFFVAFKAFSECNSVGGGWLVVVCSCDFGRIYKELLNFYNERVKYKADTISITSLTILDKQTAAQLSNNFADGTLIIDDGGKEDEKQVEIEAWLARDKNNDLWLYVCKNKPIKYDVYWSCDEDSDCMEIDGSLFQEVRWSDAEPTKVKLVIDK